MFDTEYLGLPSPVVDLDREQYTPTKGPAVFIGSRTNLQTVRGENGIVRICRLRPGPDGTRSAFSGCNSSNVARQLEQQGLVNLGENPDAAEHFAIVEDALLACHTVLSAEALTLGQSVGLDQVMLHQAISSAAGGSWAFKHLVPLMFGEGSGSDDWTLADATAALRAASQLAAEHEFYCPLTALALQMYQAALCVTSPNSGSYRVRDAYPPAKRDVAKPRESLAIEGSRPSKVGFVGLGSMGLGMAKVLINAGMEVSGYDVFQPSIEKFAAAGGSPTDSPIAVSRDAQVLVLMVVNAKQARDILFEGAALTALPENSTILLMCTAGPTDAATLAHDVRMSRPSVRLVDCPVSGGVVRAASGELTILCAGLEDDHPGAEHAVHVLNSLSGRAKQPSNLVFVPGGAGKGAAVKLVNQHQAGTHISSTMETLAFASRLGLPLRKTRELLLQGPGESWMMGHRGENMLDGLLQPPTSMISIFVKDMGIVTQEAETLGCPVPLASHVSQQFILGSAMGWSRDDDSSLVRLWRSSGIDVTCSE